MNRVPILSRLLVHSEFNDQPGHREGEAPAEPMVAGALRLGRSLALPFRTSFHARLYIALASLLFLLAVPLYAAPVEQVERTRDGAIVRAELDQEQVELAGSVVLKLSIEAKTPLEVEPIKSLTASKSWVVTVLNPPEVSTQPRDRTRWRQSFRLEPLQPNAEGVALPLEPVRFRAGDNAGMTTVSLKPFTVRVTTVVAGPAISGIKDIPAPIQLPEPEPLPWWWIGTGAGVVLGLGCLIGVRRRWQRQAPPEPIELAPAAWALRELERVEGLALPSTGEVERYHTLLADVVRRYMDRRFGLRSAEQTTPELLSHLQQTALMSGSQQEQLRSFLQRCDLAKFARTAYAPEDCKLAGRLARDFIEQTASALPLVASTVTS